MTVVSFPSQHEAESPKDRLLRAGPDALSDAELLGLLLKRGSQRASTTEIAQQLLDQVGGLIGLIRSAPEEWGPPLISDSQQASILAGLELFHRMNRAQLKIGNLLERPDHVAKYLFLKHYVPDQEVLGMLMLDSHNRLIDDCAVFRGTLTRAAVEPRPILKKALMGKAASVILFHTHPSGDPAPSAEDLGFTRRFAAASELLGIRLVDHMILGCPQRWVSLSQRGAW